MAVTGSPSGSPTMARVSGVTSVESVTAAVCPPQRPVGEAASGGPGPVVPAASTQERPIEYPGTTPERVPGCVRYRWLSGAGWGRSRDIPLAPGSAPRLTAGDSGKDLDLDRAPNDGTERGPPRRCGRARTASHCSW